MILTALIGAGFLSIGFENLGFFFLIIFYLTPLWILFGLIVSKRRFPYLLSLIIGLGIPIFLSYVAYLIPAFAIIWGFIFLKETINFNTFLGLLLSNFSISFKLSSDTSSNLLFLGRYCRTKPLVCSFRPLSHEWYGVVK